MAYENKGALAATIVVAASDSLNKGAANYVCLGAADEVIIQEALDALPASGGEVLLLEGTYQCAASIVMDSYQTLRGCGRGTILTASAIDVDIITATGGSGTEKVGILIKDLCVDGNAGGSVNDVGIKWQYVDRSRIEGCWIRDNGEHGMQLTYCDYIKVTNNYIDDNTGSGITLWVSIHGNIIGNTIVGNGEHGISLYQVSYIVTASNTCNGSTADGIIVAGDGGGNANYNILNGNVCTGNTDDGIEISGGANAVKNIVLGNQLLGNTGTALVDLGTDTSVAHNISV